MDTAVNFPTTPKAVKAVPIVLSKRMDVEQAFQAIAFACLEHAQSNAAGVAHFHDVESVHQMRVGLRRLRSALSMFKQQLRLPAAIQDELGWLLGQLGPVRDWDVLSGATLAVVGDALPDDAALAQLREAAYAHTAQCRDAAAHAIGSARYLQLMQALTKWIAERGWRMAQSPRAKRQLARPVRGFSRATLRSGHRRLLRRGRGLDAATPEARHRVRIAAKKTRYATEFFASLYPARRVRPYVSSLSSLQDDLGWLNDVAVGVAALAGLVNGRDDLKEGAGVARGYLSSRAELDTKDLLRRWKKFAAMRAPC